MWKNLNGFTNIRSKQDRKMHFEDDNTTFCVRIVKYKKILFLRRISGFPYYQGVKD